MSTQSDEQRQPTSASTPMRPTGLAAVRTAADAAEVLRRRATDFLTRAMIEPSPIHANALRKAGATVNAIAVAMDRSGRDDVVAVAALMHLARDYRETHQADLRDPDFEDYQRVRSPRRHTGRGRRATEACRRSRTTPVCTRAAPSACDSAEPVSNRGHPQDRRPRIAAL